MEEKKSNSEKRKPKNPIKFNIVLNNEQKEAKAIILEKAITVLTGKAGSGKTLLACQVALDKHFTREIERIIIARPAVSKEDLGFLPGDLYQKMEPWMQPIYDNLYMLYDKVKIDKMITDGIIQIIPLAFMRGRTFTDSVVIIDEAQNITHEQMEMTLTRLGRSSKMILCGDIAQNDLKRKNDSGFSFLVKMAERLDSMGVFHLQTNHRHSIVDEILEEYRKHREDTQSK